MVELPLASQQPTDDHFMREALREAVKAYDCGEVPVGAVVVHGRTVIARAHNQVETLKDATAHAEMIALTQASAHLGDWRLNECSLYVTKEPCAMCAGACVNSRVGRIVFGVEDKKCGACGSTAMDVARFPDHNVRPEVVPGVCGPECLSLLQRFFKRARQKSPGPAGEAL